MKIDILCSDTEHPVNEALSAWMRNHADTHDIALLRKTDGLRGGDILFLVSCHEVVGSTLRGSYRHTLVLHASDLPEGRGWSPHVWSILNGARGLTVSLLDAEDAVDSGAIWAKARFDVPDHALHEEIDAALFKAEMELMDRAIDMVANGARPTPQAEDGATYWPRRRPEDSEIDPHRPLDEVFDAIRVADPRRYPAFFRLRGHVYTIELRKVGTDETDHD